MQELGQISIQEKAFYFNPSIRLDVVELSNFVVLCEKMGAPRPELVTFHHDLVCTVVDLSLISVNNVPLSKLNINDCGQNVTIREDIRCVVDPQDDGLVYVHDSIGMPFSCSIKEKITELIKNGSRTFHFDSRHFLDNLFEIAVNLKVREEMVVRVNNTPVMFGLYCIQRLDYQKNIILFIKKPNVDLKSLPRLSQKYSEESLRQMIKDMAASGNKCNVISDGSHVTRTDDIFRQAREILNELSCI